MRPSHVVLNYDHLIAQAIKCDKDTMIQGNCSFNINEALGIRQSIPENNDVGILVQDIVLAATSFVGTVVLVGLVISSIMIILGGFNGSSTMASNGKKGLGYSVLGFLLVAFSFVIIRAVQYIARG